MRIISLGMVCVIFLALPSMGQKRLLDQPMILKSCNIKIDANPFTATTFLELEFYNPHNQEMEGLEYFQLNPGQIITGFQLDLHGKYRDASIEEKWKANNTYNSIVGKRIDPAIIQMQGNNRYSLNIYPIAAKSTRKVTITLLQMMKHENDSLLYTFPLSFKTPVQNFKIEINGSGFPSVPQAGTGIIQERTFDAAAGGSKLRWVTTDLKLNEAIAFAVFVGKDKPLFCMSGTAGKFNYLLRIDPTEVSSDKSGKKNVVVFWDISGSATSRNIVKEIDFLQGYIEKNLVGNVRVCLFNEKIVDERDFNVAQSSAKLRQFLSLVQYTGGTSFSALDFRNRNAEVALVFTDGIHTTGRSAPAYGAMQVSCIVSSKAHDKRMLQRIAGTTGGAVIDIVDAPVSLALFSQTTSASYLMDIHSEIGAIVNKNALPVRVGKPMFLSGTLDSRTKLKLKVGSDHRIEREIVVDPVQSYSCDTNVYRQVELLRRYESIQTTSNWNDLMFFGLEERVVTQNTAFLVLERIEDYINYKIAPPKELEAECAARGYIYQPRHKKTEIKVINSQTNLNAAVSQYNQLIRWWDINAPLIRLIEASVPALQQTSAVSSDGIVLNGKVGGVMVTEANSMQEVVVTSAFQTRRSMRSTSSNVQNITAEQLNTVRTTDINNALAGKIAGAQVRSQSVAALGRESTIRLRGENALTGSSLPIYVVDGTIVSNASDINMDNIEDLTVLQGPASAALFGSEGANGAIVITTKKGKRIYHYSGQGTYRLIDLEDEHHLQEIKKVRKKEMTNMYHLLSLAYPENARFHFDMAQYFFEKGLHGEAHSILRTAIEHCKGRYAGMLAAAFIRESWNEFDTAIQIYEELLIETPTDKSLMRQLALAFYQDRQYQQSVDMYMQILLTTSNGYWDEAIKGDVLHEMNAVIQLHRPDIDMSKIPVSLIRALPVDLKVSVISSNGNNNNFSVVDPLGFTVNNYSYNYHRSTEHFRKYYSVSRESILLKHAFKGSYSVIVNAYDYDQSIPIYAKVITFKDFHKPDQKLIVQLVQLNNQHGSVEIGKINW